MYAAGEDAESDEESWVQVMEELSIAPSSATARKDVQIAQGKAPTAGVGNGPTAGVGNGPKKNKKKGKKGKKKGKK